MTATLDGGYIHSSDQKSRRDGWFQAVCGTVTTHNGTTRRFGFVPGADQTPRSRIRSVLDDQGLRQHQLVTFLTDGAEDLAGFCEYMTTPSTTCSTGSTSHCDSLCSPTPPRTWPGPSTTKTISELNKPGATGSGVRLVRACKCRFLIVPVGFLRADQTRCSAGLLFHGCSRSDQRRARALMRHATTSSDSDRERSGCVRLLLSKRVCGGGDGPRDEPLGET